MDAPLVVYTKPSNKTVSHAYLLCLATSADLFAAGAKAILHNQKDEYYSSLLKNPSEDPQLAIGDIEPSDLGVLEDGDPEPCQNKRGRPVGAKNKGKRQAVLDDSEDAGDTESADSHGSHTASDKPESKRKSKVMVIDDVEASPEYSPTSPREEPPGPGGTDEPTPRSEHDSSGGKDTDDKASEPKLSKAASSSSSSSSTSSSDSSSTAAGILGSQDPDSEESEPVDLPSRRQAAEEKYIWGPTWGPFVVHYTRETGKKTAQFSVTCPCHVHDEKDHNIGVSKEWLKKYREVHGKSTSGLEFEMLQEQACSHKKFQTKCTRRRSVPKGESVESIIGQLKQWCVLALMYGSVDDHMKKCTIGKDDVDADEELEASITSLYDNPSNTD